MAYQPPNRTLLAPAPIARQVAQPAPSALATPAAVPDSPTVDVAELAERVYQLLLRDLEIDQERWPNQGER